MEIYYDHLKEVFLERNPKFDCDYECNWGFYLWSANLVWKIHSQTTNDKHSIALVENVQRQKWRDKKLNWKKSDMINKKINLNRGTIDKRN